jgi:tetratricopeptide (TPR) repeat protein
VALLSLVAWVALLRAGRSAAALGLAWIWIAFLPAANLTPQLHARAERYLFLSVFGAALLVADLLPLVFRTLSARARSAGFAVLGAVLVLGLAQRTWVRLPDWRSTETLFERDVAREPDFREGRYHLAKAYFLSQRYSQAAEHLDQLTAALTSGSPARASYVNEIGLHELACNNDLASGRPDDAVRRVTRLRAASAAIADLPGIQSCLGMALEQQGRQQEALTSYLGLLGQLEGEPPPGFALSLARVYARLGRAEEAREWLERARATGPREPVFDSQLRAVERMLR